jgi:hypothetical protein
MKVYTTLIKAEQEAAYNSLRKGVMDYDRRHGYRGAESYLDMKEIKSDQDEAIDEALQDIPDAGDLLRHWCCRLMQNRSSLPQRAAKSVTLSGDAMKFAAKMLDDKAPPNKRIKRGAIIRLQKDDKGGWQISQLPEVESAFVAVDPKMAQFVPWSAVLISIATNSITSPRLGASLVPASSHSSTRHRWKRATAQAASSMTNRSLSIRPADRLPGLGAAQLRRQVRRPDENAYGAGQVQEHGIDPHSAIHRHSLCSGLCRSLWFRRRPSIHLI